MSPRSWEMCELLHTRGIYFASASCKGEGNSGHELGHLGLDAFMVREQGWERPISEGGAIWIHFRANIIAAGGELSLQSASDELLQLTEAELVRADQAPDVVAP